jgi:enoyl-CoA hydratase
LETVESVIQIVKISRPQVLNALNTETLLELRGVLEDLAKDGHTRVVVVTGEGERAFVAGADIQEMSRFTTKEAVSFSQLGQQVTKLLQLMEKPTVAAVHGYALGGGTELALACDFVFCSETAVFGQPEVGLGIIPGFGAAVRLGRHVGLPRAKELLFTGRKIKAHEAFQMGLVNKVLPPDGLMEHTLEVCRQMAKNSFQALGRLKKLINEFSEMHGLDYKLDAEAHEFGQLFQTYDQKEGMEAFLEKRRPSFG